MNLNICISIYIYIIVRYILYTNNYMARKTATTPNIIDPIIEPITLYNTFHVNAKPNIVQNAGDCVR